MTVINPIEKIDRDVKILKYGNNRFFDFGIDKHGNIINLKTGSILKKSISSNGYYVTYIPLGKRGKIKAVKNHKALADTYLTNPNPEKFNIVHHRDENKLHCELDNLEFVDNKLNIHYHLKEKAKITPYFNNRKLTKKQVEEIFVKHFVEEKTFTELSRLYNVSKTTISNVINKKYYANEIFFD